VVGDLTFLHSADPAFGSQQGLTLMNVHPAEACAGEFCCIHNPSPHHMVTWPLNWRADRGIMERICPHGTGHPDPDCSAYRKRAYEARGPRFDEDGWEIDGWDSGVHGCEGCCSGAGR
jgi:hypothetical protein